MNLHRMIKLLGKPVADSILEKVQERTRAFINKHQRAPQLSVIIVGTDPASVIYTRKKGEAATALGMKHQTISLLATATPSEVKSLVDQLNQDPKVDGILIQRPLPSSFKEEEVLYWVAPEKDVDAFHPINAGKLFLGLSAFQPCTPAGIMKLLSYYNINPSGKIACVIGRSSIVGKPMASLLLKSDATVFQCHSRTKDLKSITTQADILIVAAGKMNFIDSSYVKKDAVVIDVGIHKDPSGKTAGDVQFESVSEKASAISPVPGGVGLLTIAVLMENTVTAAENSERNQ